MICMDSFYTLVVGTVSHLFFQIGDSCLWLGNVYSIFFQHVEYVRDYASVFGDQVQSIFYCT